MSVHAISTVDLFVEDWDYFKGSKSQPPKGG